MMIYISTVASSASSMTAVQPFLHNSSVCQTDRIAIPVSRGAILTRKKYLEASNNYQICIHPANKILTQIYAHRPN